MYNYYGLFPTSTNYSISLGLSPEISGIISASTALGAWSSFFVYNYYTGNSYSFYVCYIYAMCFSVLGNTMYTIASRYSSVILLVAGRAFIGIGGARILSRKYIG